MKTAIIGAIGDYQYDQIKYWVNSLNRSGFTGRKILLSYNSSADLITKLVQNGIEVYEARTDSFGKVVDNFVCNTGVANKDNTAELIHHLRFWHMYQLLREHASTDVGWVIHTDVRDVIFQTNPSDWLSNFDRSADPDSGKNSGKTIVAPSEYVTYGEESWNADLANSNYGPYIFKNILRDSLVYNVGSFAAQYDDFLDLALFTYLLTYRRNKLSDQPAQALLFSTLLKDKVYTAGTQDAWALQCGIIMEQVQKYANQIRGGLPAIRDVGMVINENGTPYCIVHQWERTLGMKQVIERKFA